jgi:hypothetical protein
VRTCAVPGRAGLIAGIDVRLPDELADSGGEWLLVSAKTRNGRIENRLRIKTIERERMAGPPAGSPLAVRGYDRANALFGRQPLAVELGDAPPHFRGQLEAFDLTDLGEPLASNSETVVALATSIGLCALLLHGSIVSRIHH